MTKLAAANREVLTADELDHVVGGSGDIFLNVYRHVTDVAVKLQPLPLTSAREPVLSFGR